MDSGSGAETGIGIDVYRTMDRCRVLGPGTRSVLWVQGCPLRCPGCIAPETLPVGEGTLRSVENLAGWLCSVSDTQGVTISGGEPFAQAAGLAALLDRVRAERPDYSAVVYSGFRHEALRRQAGARILLDRVDLLIDGPFRASAQADLRWRGSANQRLIPLTDRYRAVVADEPDTGAGIEVELDRDGSVSWAGVPAEPEFRGLLEQQLAGLGYHLAPIPPRAA